MGKHEQALVNFIDKRGYLNNDDVLGIVFYGSYLTGYNSAQSDIDLHIIKLNDPKIIRGVKMVDGFKFEYFEKPIIDLYLSADNDFNNQSNALVSIIGKGKIIYDKNGSIAALQKYILAKYSQPLPPIIDDEAKEMVCIIDNLIIRLQKMADIQDPEFDHIYHLTIEKIRKFYHRLLGCPEVPAEKASLIFEFYQYAKRNIKIDPEDYQILIKSRNDPNNYNHR